MNIVILGNSESVVSILNGLKVKKSQKISIISYKKKYCGLWQATTSALLHCCRTTQEEIYKDIRVNDHLRHAATIYRCLQ